jgi:AraC-like DNA-binding protein
MDHDSIIKWISENIDKANDISSIASVFNVSWETLRKTFQRREGVSLSRYLREQKVDAVKKRLIQTDDRCFEIIYSLNLGREDVFARTFKNATGMTMEEFRESERRRESDVPLCDDTTTQSRSS